MDANPCLIEVYRNELVESRHRGAFCVVDQHSNVVLKAGDIEQKVYPRSGVKIIQALPLVTSGAADYFGFTDQELALICSSHGAESEHIEILASIFDKIDVDPKALECGIHWPMFEAAGRELARQGLHADARHNNCSGKHAGLLAMAKYSKHPLQGYSQLSHPLQQIIRRQFEDLAQLNLSHAPVGIDGCSIPTWAMPLRSIAEMMQKFSEPSRMNDKKLGAAMARLSHATRHHPHMVAGTQRYCSVMMGAFAEDIFVKIGAEGIFCAFVRSQKLGIAVKSDDGAFRGAEAILSGILNKLGAIDERTLKQAGCEDLLQPVIRNHKQIEVGHVEVCF
ncbi:asparaginase [Alginatibacterium sediminis]|uniref:Asparaginase n=1 Tax=Alginatibacterium sediminis TaxID=2164068 RepID=A0A420E776_9ALTE|nr:asparaginase [Alginatibacterium sediminis]RKF14268.1 asparaginase [Alginatibacterium sediminis]